MTKYTQCHCGADCWMHGKHADQPCWGPVEAVDDLNDGSYIHACSGHEDSWDRALGQTHLPEYTADGTKKAPI